MTRARTSLRPARQRRSKQSLERIVAALDELIEEKTFEEITVSEVCTRAGVAVGTFYDRVGSKDALLEHLRQRFYAGIVEQIEAAYDPARFAELDLESMIAVNAREMVALHRRRQGAIRAIIVEARRTAAFGAHARELNRFLLDRVTRAWLRKRDAFRAGDPETLARHAFLMAAGFLREAVVWDGLWPSEGGTSDDALALALEAMLIGFLTGPNGSTT